MSSLLEAAHNGPLPSQTAGAHHEIGDNKAPGGPTSLTSGVSSGVSSTFHAYEDPPGLHEKVLCMQDRAPVVQKLDSRSPSDKSVSGGQMAGKPIALSSG